MRKDMATRTNDKEGALKSALRQLDALLEGAANNFDLQANICLGMLEKALVCLNANECLTRASVEVQALLESGKRYVRKYSLATRRGEDLHEETYLKQSVTEEDE